MSCCANFDIYGHKQGKKQGRSPSLPSLATGRVIAGIVATPNAATDGTAALAQRVATEGATAVGATAEGATAVGAGLAMLARPAIAGAARGVLAVCVLVAVHKLGLDVKVRPVGVG